MPTMPDILGFGNEWYRLALENEVAVELPSGQYIRIVNLLFFCALCVSMVKHPGK